MCQRMDIHKQTSSSIIHELAWLIRVKPICSLVVVMLVCSCSRFRAIQSHLLTGVIISNNEPAVFSLVMLAHFFFSEFFLWDLRCHGYDCCLVAFDDNWPKVLTIIILQVHCHCLHLHLPRAWQVTFITFHFLESLTTTNLKTSNYT